MSGLRTEFPFTLPKGFIGDGGTLHRHGTMRLATARDEIEPLRDPAVDGPDDPYLTVLVLSRVITELGDLDGVSPADVERFFAADLAFLQDLYGIINFGDPADVEALQASVLPDQGTTDAEPDTAADTELDEPDSDDTDDQPGPDDTGDEPAAADDADDDTDDEPTANAKPTAADRRKAVAARRRGHIEEVSRSGRG